MSSSAAIAERCLLDLERILAAVPVLSKRVFQVYSEEELLEKTKGLSYPCVGVVYDGMRASGENKDTGKQGVSAELVCTIMLFFRQESLAKQDAKLVAVTTLDGVRDAIRGVRSPSGHFWKFQLEASVGGKNGVLTYLQRWSTPVQLV